jgi:hypothetical protein
VLQFRIEVHEKLALRIYANFCLSSKLCYSACFYCPTWNELRTVFGEFVLTPPTGALLGSCFAVRYLAPEVRQGRGHHEVALARGRDRYQHFEKLKEPPLRSVRDGIC